MGRIYNTIDVRGRKYWTWFDSSALHTYVTSDVANSLVTSNLKEPLRAAIGGSVHQITQTAIFNGELEGLPISIHAMVVDQIGDDESGNPIEILFGALAMRQWGIRLIPEQQKLDLTHYPTVFVEF